MSHKIPLQFRIKDIELERFFSSSMIKDNIFQLYIYMLLYNYMYICLYTTIILLYYLIKITCIITYTINNLNIDNFFI